MRLSRALASSFVTTFVFLLSAPINAQYAQPDVNGQPVSLPYLDARLDVDRTRGEVLQAVVDARSTEQRAARAQELQRLTRSIAGLQVDEHEFFGTPSFIRSNRSLLTAPRPGTDGAQIVRDYVAAWPAVFEVPAAELDRSRVARDFFTKHNGVRHFTWQQQLDGIDIWGAELKANVSARGELINISSSLLPRPVNNFAPTAAVIGSGGALRLAAADAGITITQPLRPTGFENGKQHWQTTNDFREGVEITTRRVWFAVTRTEIHPAWEVVVPVPGIGNTYETMIDATTGAVLRRWNQMHFLGGGSQDITFNVWTDDSPAPLSPGLASPTGFQAAEVPRTLVTVTAASVADASPNGWIDDGDTTTLGNNVDAHTDIDANNSPDLPRPDGGAGRVFDFPIDLSTQTPSQYVEHSATQLFYYANRYHDALYRLGWDEPASNFQNDNFGMGGVDGDRLQADAQDGSSVNNAQYFGSGGDGSSTRIQMYTWDGPTPDRDGSFDGDVIYHEISHGLSIRLSGGTVSGEQSGGMGEGWGDYFGVSLNARPGDDPHGPFAMGGYVTADLFGSNDNYYFGIRRYPYSTDLNTSPLTYADTDPAQFVVPGGIPNNGSFINNPADGVHPVGEIWCNALLACRAELWDVHGFSANELMMQLVVDGLKLMPSNPNMLDARDAILEADLVNNGGANLGELWAGFALRGLGESASSPAGGSSTTGVVEAFDVPPLVTFAFPSGTPDQLDPGVSTPFAVTINSLGNTSINGGSETLRVSINGAGAVSFPLTDNGGGNYTAELPPLDCFDTVDYWFEVSTNQGVVSNPSGAPGISFGAAVFTSVDSVFADAFESDLGWDPSAPGDDASTGIWTRVDPNGTGAQPEDDDSDPGTFAFVTGQGSPGGTLGENDVDGGSTTLTSPVIDLSGGDARIGYSRWYSNDTGGAPNADVFVIDVSNNGGGNWVNVEVVGPTGPETSGGWFRHEFLVSDFVAPTNNVRVRFIASDLGTGSVVEAAVDEFSVVRLVCEASCQTDLGFGGPGDLSLSICGTLGSGDVASLTVENADPFAMVFNFVGFTNMPTAFQGGQLVPFPYATIVGVSANGAGSLALNVPGGGGPFTVFVQSAAMDATQTLGVELSNAVQAEFLP
ncbi:MAG: hypothetical protein DHS20C15_27270 [Planctomycetota bacterium]|nr:MAG: hypothetical protein DHS20C15_27270 [Planctomycetota bacterium]